ncbi:genetic interactor of prohibitin 7, mitochondrial [Diutina catenulata]
MFGRSLARTTRPVHQLVRWQSQAPPPKPEGDAAKLSPEEARKQAAQLAMQSLKDMGSIFGSGSDDATQPIDTKPVWSDPTLFGSLSLLHQGQVLKELQAKYDKDWRKLTPSDKHLGYYIAYGNWGSREKFDNWNTLEAPYDLPFVVPSQVATVTPKPTTIIHELPRVILAETPVRKPQFNFKRMDAVTKVFIYLTLFITVAALFRDKKIGEEGRPHEVIVEDPYEQERVRRQQEEEQAQAMAQALALEEERRRNSKKWYYLWLK